LELYCPLQKVFCNLKNIFYWLVYAKKYRNKLGQSYVKLRLSYLELFQWDGVGVGKEVIIRLTQFKFHLPTGTLFFFFYSVVTFLGLLLNLDSIITLLIFVICNSKVFSKPLFVRHVHFCHMYLLCT
jgi:hypothetical protein